jgi:ABC-type oligopeptide transport system substrate-binding subunit
MNLKKIPASFSTIFLACTVLLVGCQPTTTATSVPQVQTATATTPPTAEENSSAEIISANLTLDPALTQDADSLTISQYLYEGLVSLDSSGTPQPALAESWIVSDDQLDYIFTMRANAKFSDGTLITPDIVVNNFNRWFDPNDSLHTSENFKTWESIFLGFNGEKDENKRPKSPVDGIQKVDVNTIIIHLNRPVPDLIKYLAYPAFSILNTESLKSDGYGLKGSTIVSSGPYVVSSWTDSGLTLSPNSNYWGTAPAGNLNYTFR